jgi:hypothetical protein
MKKGNSSTVESISYIQSWSAVSKFVRCHPDSFHLSHVVISQHLVLDLSSPNSKLQDAIRIKLWLMFSRRLFDQQAVARSLFCTREKHMFEPSCELHSGDIDESPEKVGKPDGHGNHDQTSQNES